MSEVMIRQWLAEFADSVARRDLKRHMALISKKVYVYGLPSKKTVDYAGWQERRHNEFSRGLLTALSHEGVKIKTIGLRRIGFSTVETMTTADGKQVQVSKDVMLEKEDDGQWRIVEEKINKWDLIRNFKQDDG